MRCKKITYETAEEAFLAVIHLRKRGLKQQGYLCSHCGKYHTGREKPGDRNGIDVRKFNSKTSRSMKRERKRKLHELRLQELEHDAS
jgi:hypothetical protein